MSDLAFGQRLRAARITAGLSQESLARRAGLSPDTVAALERGRRRLPRPSTMFALASALGLHGRERAELIGTSPPAPTTGTNGTAGGGEAAPGGNATAGGAAATGGAAVGAPGADGPGPSRDPTLFGRDGDLAALGRLMRPAGTVRLITLVGPGGVGKTTLATAAARAYADRYTGGWAYVDLSQITEESLVVPGIARAVRLPNPPGTAVELSRAVAGRHLLLLLDAAERLGGIGRMLDDLVRHAADLTVLVTSRIPLGCPAEYRFAVRPLPVPDAPVRDAPAPAGGGGEDTPWFDPERLAANPAVQLFVARAHVAVPDFRVDAANAADVARLCAGLGGIPLALELAAARLSLLSVDALVERMHDSLDLLNENRSGRLDRTRSVRATLDWSYEILDPPARRLFATLAVFRGGFDVAAAEAVAPDDPGASVLDGLQDLVDGGLLVRSRHDARRLSMLDTVQEYARTRLSGDGAAAAAGRHLAYYLALAESADPDLNGPRQAEQLARLDREHDNLRAALDWAVEHSHASALRLAVALWRFWQLRGHLDEGRRRLGTVLALAGGATDLRAQAGYGAAVLCFAQGDLAAAGRHGQASLDLYRAAASDGGMANALNVLGNVARELGEYERATARYEESLALSRRAGNLAGAAATLNNLGTTARYQGDLAKARRLHDESLRLRVVLQDVWGVANCLDNLANTAVEAGDLDSAVQYGVESLERREQLGDRHGAAVSLVTLAGVYRARGDHADAVAAAERAANMGRTVNDVWVTAGALATLVAVADDRGDWPSVARLAGALCTYQELTGATLRPSDAARLAEATARARQQMQDTAYECAWVLGRATDARAAVPPLAPLAPPPGQRPA